MQSRFLWTSTKYLIGLINSIMEQKSFQLSLLDREIRAEKNVQSMIIHDHSLITQLYRYQDIFNNTSVNRNYSYININYAFISIDNVSIPIYRLNYASSNNTN